MVSISTELFFNEAEFRLIIPNHPKETEGEDPIAIIKANPREFAFYGKESRSVPEYSSCLQVFLDEHLQVYLLASVSRQISGAGEEVKDAIHSFYNQLEVTVDATFLDTITPNLNRSSSITTQSSPTSPKIHQRRTINEVSTPFFTQAYNRNNKNAEFLLFEQEDTFCCLYPIIVPIGKHTAKLYNDRIFNLVSDSICKDEDIQSSLIHQLQYSIQAITFKKSKHTGRIKHGR